MKTKKENTKDSPECYCKNCGNHYLKSEVARIYGKESNVFYNNFCSANCFTQYTNNPKKQKNKRL